MTRRLHGASTDFHAAALQNIKNALKEYAYIKICSPAKDMQIVSIIAITTEIEEVLMPQKLGLVSFCNTIEKLNCEYSPDASKHSSIQLGIEALSKAAKYITQIKKKHRESMNIRVFNFSSTWLPANDKTNTIMKSLSENNAEVHFYHIEFLSANDEEETEDFAYFLKLSKWENCQLTRIGNFSIQRTIKSLAATPLFISSLKLLFLSQEIIINCDLHKPLFDLSNIPQVDTCSCHHKRLLSNSSSSSSSSSSSCSISGESLSANKIDSAFQLGTLLIGMPSVPKLKRIIELEVLKRVKLGSLSDHLLYQEPYMIYSVEVEFLALCQLLNEKDEALLAASFYDLETGNRKFIKQYFLIFPSLSPDTGFMLLKKIATEEHLKPLPLHKIFNVPTEENFHHISSILNSIESIDYDPLDFNGGLYASIESAILNTSNQHNKPISSTQVQATRLSKLNIQDSSPSQRKRDTTTQSLRHITDNNNNDKNNNDKNDNKNGNKNNNDDEDNNDDANNGDDPSGNHPQKSKKGRRVLHPLRKISLD